MRDFVVFCFKKRKEVVLEVRRKTTKCLLVSLSMTARSSSPFRGDVRMVMDVAIAICHTKIARTKRLIAPESRLVTSTSRWCRLYWKHTRTGFACCLCCECSYTSFFCFLSLLYSSHGRYATDPHPKDT